MKKQIFCDECGEDITNSRCVWIPILPFSLSSANIGESAVLCQPCFDIAKNNFCKN